MDEIIKERRDATNINYTLENNDIFFDIGYKVLKNQSSNGFIKCNKVIHNGKIKLIFDTSKYLSLEILMSSLTSDKLIKIIIKLMKIVINIKDNGFMEYKNINTNINSIFIDINKLDIYLIYLPINIVEKKDDKTFFIELKNNIIEGIKKSKILNDANVNKVIDILMYNNGIELVISELNKIEIDTSRSQIYSKPYEEDLSHKRIEEKSPIVRDTKKKRGILGGLFSKNKDKKHTSDDNFSEYDDISGELSETTLINSENNSLIKLVSLNSPNEITLNVTKCEFIIGSNIKYADGVINFNKAISRKHCKISIIDDEFYITDLESSNGTFLNGRRLDSNIKYGVRVGDIVRLANSEFKVVSL